LFQKHVEELVCSMSVSTCRVSARAFCSREQIGYASFLQWRSRFLKHVIAIPPVRQTARLKPLNQFLPLLRAAPCARSLRLDRCHAEPHAIRQCYQRPTDMRKSFTALIALVKHQLSEDPLSGHLFAFINKRRTYVKVLD
jgi:hypothetical protein